MEKLGEQAGPEEMESRPEADEPEAFKREMRIYDRVLIAIILIASVVFAMGWWFFNDQPGAG